ncbi:MAG: hypothetical protein VB032_08345, partial [Burkholderiaceae bacterium]|nr:hypothetical protein [Burkholderiaceae bacterium]
MVTKQRNTPKTAVAGVVPVNGNILLTKWTAPDPVTKQLSLSPNGTVQKTSTASQLYEGKVMQVECTPSEFIDVLNSIGSNDCLSYGIPLDANVTHVLSKKKFQNSGAPSGVTTRTADKMDWPKGPAILMIDYDPNETELYTPKKLLDTIYQCCPAIRSVAHIHAASASSCLWNSNTRQQVKGMEGQRVYIIVADGTDIPRASEVLFKRTWLNGHGYIKISSAGSMLVRSIIDDSVFQPNRIDYCAPPICTAPLESRKPKPKLWGKATLVLDTRTALPELTPEEESRYNQLVDTAKSSAKVPAAAKRAEYQGKRVDEMVAQGSTRETAEKVVGDMLDKKVLHGDVVLHATDGQIVTVRDILLNKSIWHGKTFADPAEPDYHNDNRIARAYLNGPGQSRIHSFAHGGCTYTLSVTVATIRLQKGERHEYMRQIVHTLRDYQEFYRRDSSLVAIGDDGSMIMVTPLMVLASLDRLIRFEKGLNKNWCAADAPLDAAKMLIEAYATEFPPIKAVLTAPIIDPESGRLLAQSGYDARTGADLFLPDDVASIPESPDLEAVNEAIGILWWPVRYFPFDSPIDQTVMFTAMLTAVMRALLPTAPGFGFDAPIQASGKTLLIKVLATLKGDSPTISPQPDARSDEEMRKRVFAVLLTGSGTIVIDNIIGEFDSPSLAAALTSEHYSDRVLGKSRSETVPTNALVLVSGNNLILKGDLPRRILKCRIDPRTETPHQREFHFDPVEVIRENRQQLVAAALTLIRAYLQQKPVERIGAGRM